MAIKHAFTSAKADGGDTTLVQPSNWNANHTIDAATITYAMIQNVSATDKLLGRSTAGAGSVEEIACTAAGRALIDDVDASAQRTTLGLGTMATANTSDYLALTGGTVAGQLVVAHPGASGDALRVTLSNGAATGNAIIVEDEANPDSTPWLVSATGNVIHGYTSTIGAQSAQTTTQLAVGGKQQLHGTTTQLATTFSTAWSTNADVASAYVMAKSRNATVGTHTATVTNEVLGYISWQGSDGTQFYRAADIRGVVNGTVSTGVVPGSLSFRVADTSGTLTERMLITNDGTTTVTGSLNATGGLKENGTALSALYAPIGGSGSASFVSMAKWGTD